MYKAFLLPLLILLSPILANNVASGQGQVQVQPKQTGKLAFLHDSVTYQWPTNASPYMSATFGETRSSHFHAALDIKTWGQRGYDVFATRDAKLHRIGIGPSGYGNVIYLKHNDGSFSVYAHLMDFIPPVRQLVDSLRMQDFSFVFDQNLESYNISFKKGDLIGYTGASGIGPPHLHFELRTPNHHPFNPLLTNISVEDNRPPRFSGLSVEPLSKNAFIEDGKNLIKRRPTWRNGYYDFGTVEVEGTVGLGVDVFDQADKVSNVYAVYELILKDQEGNIWFNSQIDSFSYDNTHQMFIDRVYPILKESRRGYQRLYIADGNTLPFYKNTQNRGRLNLKPGTHTFFIEASDYHGNRSKAKITIYVSKPDPQVTIDHNRKLLPSGLVTSSDIHLTSLPEAWSENWIATRSDSQTFLQTTSLFSNHKTIGPNALAANPLLTFSTTLPVPIRVHINNTEFILHRILPGEKSTLYSPDQRMRLSFNKESVYDTLSIGINYKIRGDSIQVDVLPHIQPLKEDLDLELLVDTSRVSLTNPIVYWYNKQRDSYYVQPTEQKGNIITAKLKSFGTHYVLSDTVKPTIKQARLYRRADRKWVITVKTDDNLSGIDYQRSRFYCNDKRGIAEYDPYTKQLIYYRPEFVPKQTNKCKVLVFDVAGNQQQHKFSIRR